MQTFPRAEENGLAGENGSVDWPDKMTGLVGRAAIGLPAKVCEGEGRGGAAEGVGGVEQSGWGMRDWPEVRS